jgi:hypothetical protein
MACQTVFVDTFTNGVLGPDLPMLGPLRDGGVIVANTAPGCWGPMLTPAIRGGHEVTMPVAVEGAEPGDSVAIRILSINVTSPGTVTATFLAPVARLKEKGVYALIAEQYGL